jgi:divalent metal cation (Fe/Co/Zn/Cd) transporter
MIFPGASIRVKGTTGLAIAAVIIVAVLIGFPAYRVFFAISVGIGIIVAGLLYLRNKYRPITDKDVENKHPLGLN